MFPVHAGAMKAKDHLTVSHQAGKPSGKDFTMNEIQVRESPGTITPRLDEARHALMGAQDNFECLRIRVICS